MVTRTRRIAVASLFGVLIFAAKGFLPPPTSDYLVVVEAFLAGLGFVILGRFGATYVELINGLLLTAVKVSFAPFSLAFALLFGVMVDGLSTAFRAKQGGEVSAKRLAASLTISTGAVGLAAYYVTAVATQLIPLNAAVTLISLTILLFGTISGAIGGYLAARVWNRTLKARFQAQR